MVGSDPGGRVCSPTKLTRLGGQVMSCPGISSPPRIHLALIVCLVSFAVAADAQVPVAATDYFLVNTQTDGHQRSPSVAMDASGGFVVVWDTIGDIHGQRFVADGTFRAGEFAVDAPLGDGQYTPAAGMSSDGSFVVVWAHRQANSANVSILGRLFTPAGVPVGESFQIPGSSLSVNRWPSVSMGSDGDFVVTWLGTAGYDFIRARRFAADGRPLSDELQVEVGNYGVDGETTAPIPSAAMAPDGSFTVVWHTRFVGPRDEADLYRTNIHGRRFEAFGVPESDGFVVNTYSSGPQKSPKVAVSRQSAVVVWESGFTAETGPDGSGLSVQARRLASDGSFDGDEFTVNTLTAGSQREPRVAASPDGDFVTVWVSQGLLKGQRFSSAGQPTGGEFEVSPVSSIKYPSVAMSSDGSFVVAWEQGYGYPGDDSGSSIWARKYEITCRPEDSMCLNQYRFKVEATFRDFNGNQGSGEMVPLRSDDSGLIWFFSPDNWEVLVKVLDGCDFNDRFWVFAAATTNVEYTLQVTDTWTGEARTYFNELGQASAAVTDTSAFTGCDVTEPIAGRRVLAAHTPPRPEPMPPSAPIRSVRQLPERGSQACVSGAMTHCLQEKRFKVEVEWQDFVGNTGLASTVQPLDATDSGIFWFFRDNNWEMLVKVLDGCEINQHFWVFSAAVTNVEYTLRVIDTERGAQVEYFNPSGSAAAAVTDTRAFPTCP